MRSCFLMIPFLDMHEVCKEIDSKMNKQRLRRCFIQYFKSEYLLIL